MVTTRGCPICAHPECAKIEALYRVRASLDKLAALFPPLKRDAIYRHCLRHPARPPRDFAKLITNAERADARRRQQTPVARQAEQTWAKLNLAQRKRHSSKDPPAVKPPRQPRRRPSRQLVSEGHHSGDLLQAEA